MPQLFQVLRCYKCLVFQGHQTKKANKFECKICGEKQSIKRHYGLGTGQECRLHVQKLNGIRGEVDEMKVNKEPDSDDEIADDTSLKERHNVLNNTQSKWSNYIKDNKVSVADTNDTMYLNNTEVVLELPQKRKRVFGSHRGRKVLKSVASNQTFNDDIYTNNSVCSQTRSNDIQIVETLISTELHQNALEFKEVNVKTIPNFKPLAINKTSKWAQFADEENAHEELLREEQTPNRENEIFSQCDDDDLDNVLEL